MKDGTDVRYYKGKVMIVIRSLYVLKSSGEAWRSMLAKMLLDLGYKPSRSDMDVWMKPDIKPQTVKEYYVYGLVYVEDLIHIHHDTEIFMKELKVVYRLKDGSLEPTSGSLSANV